MSGRVSDAMSEMRTTRKDRDQNAELYARALNFLFRSERGCDACERSSRHPRPRHPRGRHPPPSREPRRGLNPRVAAKNKWARIAALQRDRAFIRAHGAASALIRASREAIFPAGTYWLKRFMNVTVAPYVPDTPLFT